MKIGVLLRSSLRAGFALLVAAASISSASAQGDAKRGAYIAKAGGCVGCHTEDSQDATPFAGGRALKTPFGTFYGPNITPHRDAGIGRWSEADFMRAMRRGVRPDGANYFPAFPYPSFTAIGDDDLRDLWAYLRSITPSGAANRPHDLGFPFGWRPLVSVWNWLFFTPGPLRSDPSLSPALNRGRYLVQALGHCGECHTPRNFLGGPKKGSLLAGARTPEGKKVPNLTPTRLKPWTDAELREFLLTGATPDGDSASKTMAEVIRNTTSQLMADDLGAMIAYLRAIPALPEDKSKSK